MFRASPSYMPTSFTIPLAEKCIEPVVYNQRNEERPIQTETSVQVASINIIRWSHNDRAHLVVPTQPLRIRRC